MKFDKFNTIDDISTYFVDNFSNRSLLLYANNAIGKTSLSRAIAKNILSNNNTLCYNAFFEEYFVWEKDYELDQYYMIINKYDTFVQRAIIEQGLETIINNNYRKLINKKIDINFDIVNDKIEKILFSLQTGDDTSVDFIKISKAEESMFIWSVFYTILEQRLLDYLDDPDNNELKYIIIDDPVTSLDDEKIVTIAIQIRKNIIDVINKIRENDSPVSFLITTHNRLFYNILFNEGKYMSKKRLYIEENCYFLCEQKDSPFGYHIEELKTLKKHIKDNNLNRNDFNIFRGVLEKTANFLGYGPEWDKCINKDLENRDEIIRLINFYSHDSLSELDDKLISKDVTELLKMSFEKFIEDYKWEESL